MREMILRGKSGWGRALVMAVVLLAALAGTSRGWAAEPMAVTDTAQNATGVANTGHLLLDVSVMNAQGQPVTGLNPLDFLVTEDGALQKVIAMQQGGLKTESATPAQMVIVLDAVNCTFEKMQLERQDVAEFLRRNGGKLVVPTRVVMLNDTKMLEWPTATTDGNALAKYIEQTPNPVHSLRFQAGYYGELDRAMWSMDQMYKLAHEEAAVPGRKLMVWISHGWHPLSRDYLAMDERDLKQDFNLDVGLTNALLQARIALVSIDPILALPGENLNYYQAFLKPVEKWEQVDTPDLMLQVLALHTGGMVLNQSTDIQGEIDRAMQLLNGWYTLVYSPRLPQGTVPPFRAINVKLKPDATPDAEKLVVRGPQGYYAMSAKN